MKRDVLTDRVIERFKPNSKQYTKTDGQGLYLLILPTGSKLWRYQYRYNGNVHLMSLGSYPVVTLKRAREKRLNIQQLLSEGIRPSGKGEVAGGAFEDIASDWLKEWKEIIKPRKNTIDGVERILKIHILPSIGKRPVIEIDCSSIEGIVQKINDQGKRFTARKALIILGQIMAFAVRKKRARNNPVLNIKPRAILGDVPEHNKHTHIKDIDELCTFIKLIDAWNNNYEKYAMKMLLLTFVRTMELLDACWNEFDFKENIWHIPSSRMKMKRDHIVPLSRQVLEILDRLKKMNRKSKYLFPASVVGSHSARRWFVLKAIYEMGYKGKMTGHGFRSVAGTGLKRLLVLGEKPDKEWREMQLAHTVGTETSRAYDHEKWLPERTEMMQVWADHVDELKEKCKVS